MVGRAGAGRPAGDGAMGLTPEVGGPIPEWKSGAPPSRWPARGERQYPAHVETPAPTPGTLHRRLGLWQVTLSGIGVILGAGVYALVAPAAARAGNALWLAFLLAGVAAALTAYAYARLGVMQPKNSPEFQYTSLAFGPRVGFVAGWLMLAADLLAAATVALGFGGYLAHLAGTPVEANALALLALVALVMALGIAESVALAMVLTLVEAGGLLFIIAVGLPSWPGADYLEMPHGMAGVWSAASLIFFAYLGFDELGNLAEEMRQPERDLPRALFLAMSITVAIYILVALSAAGAVGWRALQGSPAPLALVAGAALGARADAALSWVALGATANTVLLLLVSASRSVYGMAAAGVLPAGLARVAGRGTPLTAVVVVIGGAGVLVLAGDLATVAALTDGAVLASFALVNLSLPWLAARGRAGSRGVRRALDVVVPGTGALFCAGLLAEAGAAAIGVAAALAALGFFLAPRR